MNLSLLIVLLFANWRLAHLIAEEGGPWDFIAASRVILGVRYDKHSRPYGTNVISSALICVWCNSFWIGIIETVAVAISPTVALWLFLPFALSAGAIIIEGVNET